MTDPCAGVPQSEYCRLKGESCNQRFEDLRDLFLATAKDQDRAIDLARANVDNKIHEVNDAKKMLIAQAAEFLPKANYEVQHRMLENKIDNLHGRIEGIVNREAEQKGRNERGHLYSIVGLIVAIAAIMVHFWKT